MRFIYRHRKRTVLLVVVVVLLGVAGAGLGIKNHTQRQVGELFRMNRELQEQGYYMADFEFKMMSLAYWLDRGHVYTALSRLNSLHAQLAEKEGLIKVPKFADKGEEFEFYRNLQNPKTGAFLDESYAYCVYNEVTENVVEHLLALAKDTGQPLQLKYPLKYLDEINTPDTLRAFLDDVSNVGWLATKFPQTTFVCARSLINFCNSEGVIGENHLYDFSPEWKQALIQWFYDNQDPQTGFWGPKSRTSGKLVKKDLTNTASIIKTFVDEEGKNRHASFPLRYRNEMFKASLEILSEPMPDTDDLTEWHEWSLKMGKGEAMITRYLWNDASLEDKDRAKTLIEDFVGVIFENYYVPVDGAFSHYPDSTHATLDGTGGKLSNLDNIGFFKRETQKRLWGEPENTLVNLGEVAISTLTAKDVESVGKNESVNSIRFYAAPPDNGNFMSGVLCVYYSKDTLILDAVELAPKVKSWIDATSQSMGNWVSKERIVEKVDSLNIPAAPVFRKEFPSELANNALQNNHTVIAIGFDALQIPRCRVTFVLKS
ncbi:MAG TPA: hypothetical protein PLI09_10850 [Candidatus Hydrogenedentes bacterium]|nr:hypothetical protein [Candidatus Hydrogenedentota bacterium]